MRPEKEKGQDRPFRRPGGRDKAPEEMDIGKARPPPAGAHLAAQRKAPRLYVVES